MDGRKWRSLVYVSSDGRVAILVLISIQGCRSAGYTQLQHTHAELPQNPSHMNTKNLGVYEGTQFMLHWEFNTQVIASGGTNDLQPRTSEMGLVVVASTTTLGRSQFFPLPLRGPDDTDYVAQIEHVEGTMKCTTVIDTSILPRSHPVM